MAQCRRKASYERPGAAPYLRGMNPCDGDTRNYSVYARAGSRLLGTMNEKNEWISALSFILSLMVILPNFVRLPAAVSDCRARSWWCLDR